jgi:hypothetical protein
MSRIAKNFLTPMMVLFSSMVLAQPGPDVAPPSFSFDEPRVNNKMPPLTVFDVALGASDYPIFEMPMASSGDLRVDGSRESQDLRRNQGALLNLGLKRSFPTNHALYSLGAGYHRASTVPGSGIPSPSAYVRMYADLTADIDLSSKISGLHIIPAVEARRSAYRNAESGHYVDGIIMKSGVSKTLSDRWQAQLEAGYAPVTRVGLLQPAYNGKSGALADSSASMSEISGKFEWSADNTASFNICAAQETVHLNFKSYDGYRAYGLPVAPLKQSYSEKSYDLTTRYLLLGTGKKF